MNHLIFLKFMLHYSNNFHFFIIRIFLFPQYAASYSLYHLQFPNNFDQDVWPTVIAQDVGPTLIAQYVGQY